MPRLSSGEFPQAVDTVTQGPRLARGLQNIGVAGTKLSRGFQSDAARLQLINEAEKVVEDVIEVKAVVQRASDVQEDDQTKSSEDAVVQASDEAIQQELESYIIKKIVPDDDTSTSSTPSTSTTGTGVTTTEEDSYYLRGIIEP